MIVLRIFRDNMAHFQVDRKKFRIPKVVRRTLITALILLLLAGIGGVAFTYFGGDSNNKQQTASKNVPAPPKPLEFKPPAPDPKAAVGAAVESLESPVVVGSNTGINVKTTAGASCAISVKYKDNESKDSGLITKNADIYGLVSWTWTVPAGTPLGTWPVKVTCTYNKKSGVVIGNLQVTK
jgi:hypothetical protein